MTSPKKVADSTKSVINPSKGKPIGQLGKRPIVFLGQGCSQLTALIGVLGLAALGVGIAAYGAHCRWWSLAPLNNLSELYTIRILEIGGGVSLLIPFGAAGWGILEISHLRRSLSHSQKENRRIEAREQKATKKTQGLEKDLEAQTTKLHELEQNATLKTQGLEQDLKEEKAKHGTLKKKKKEEIKRLQKQIERHEAQSKKLTEDIAVLQAKLDEAKKAGLESAPINPEGKNTDLDPQKMKAFLEKLTTQLTQLKEERVQEMQTANEAKHKLEETIRKHEETIRKHEETKHKLVKAERTLKAKLQKQEQKLREVRIRGVKFKKRTLLAPVGQRFLAIKGSNIETEKDISFPRYPRIVEKEFFHTLFWGAPSLVKTEQGPPFWFINSTQPFPHQRGLLIEAPSVEQKLSIEEVMGETEDFMIMKPPEHLTPEELYKLGYRYPDFAAQKHQTFLEDYRIKLAEESLLYTDLDVFYQRVTKAAQENSQNALLPLLQLMLLGLMEENPGKSGKSFTSVITNGRKILEHAQFKNPSGKDLNIRDELLSPFLEAFFWIYWQRAEAYGYMEANLRACVELPEDISLDKEDFLNFNEKVKKSNYNKNPFYSSGTKKAKGETGYQDFCGGENHPHQVNEHVYGTEGGKEKRILFRRHGNPTYWGKVTSDYEFYLTLLEKKQKSLLYCQYQRRNTAQKGVVRATTDWIGATESEDHRVRAIEALQKTHKNFYCLTQPVEGDLFDRKGKYAGKSREDLKKALEDEFFDKRDSSAALPSYIADDKKRKEDYRKDFNKLLDDVEILFFKDMQTEWNDASWKNYILLFYAFQRRDLLFRLDNKNNCSLDTFNTTCKDDLDRGGNQRFVEYILNLLLLGELDDPKRKEEVFIQILGPTQAVKTQDVIPEKIEPGLDLLAYLKTLPDEKIIAFQKYTFGKKKWKLKTMPPANPRKDQTAVPRVSSLIQGKMKKLIGERDVYDLGPKELQELTNGAKKIFGQYVKRPVKQWERFKLEPSSVFFVGDTYKEDAIKEQVIKDIDRTERTEFLVTPTTGKRQNVSSYEGLKKELLAHPLVAKDEQKALQVIACFNQSIGFETQRALQEVCVAPTIMFPGDLDINDKNNDWIETVISYELDLSGPNIRFCFINHTPLVTVDARGNREVAHLVKSFTEVEFSAGEKLLKTESRFCWSIIK